ncbi:UNVERIFIED_CONTAM: 3-hydroxybutyryl-CoA dehydrogenase [Brevibacillus sp. OAP136]
MMKEIKQVAVIGAGIMGHGIAQIFAAAGFSVRLYDIHEHMLQKAKEAIEASLSLFVTHGMISVEQKEQALGNISLTISLAEAVADADFITEAIPEKVELKWEIYRQIEELAREDAVVASNTSTIPITQLARYAKYPERMIITHYFNPAYLVPLVEVVKHEKTATSVVELTLETMKRIGKVPVLLQKEIVGFIANRLQAAVVREAFHLLEEGVAGAAQIDAAMKAGPGFRWAFIGPFETLDFGGVDTWQSAMNNVAPELCNATQAPAMINQLVERGELGVKTGSGIYAHTPETVAAAIELRDQRFLSLLHSKQNETAGH